MSHLVGIATETLAIIEAGGYTGPEGWVDLRGAIDGCLAGTRLVPDDLELGSVAQPGDRHTRIEVTDETTGRAARRLAAEHDRVLALNYASARNPGGGFIRGARAQEEDLARCSALYPSLLTQPRYYADNRAHPSPAYRDHAIYSPDVPFFRGDDLALLPRPYLLSIVTAPAPNAGELARAGAFDAAGIAAILARRATRVLAIAAREGHGVLVLGAWGCGVFRNDPATVASVFSDLLGGPFCGRFERVVFAVYDKASGQPNLAAFTRRFGGER